MPLILGLWSMNLRQKGMGGGKSLRLFIPDGCNELSLLIHFDSHVRRARLSLHPGTCPIPLGKIKGYLRGTCSRGVILRKSIFLQIWLKCFETGHDSSLRMVFLCSLIRSCNSDKFFQHRLSHSLYR